MVLNFLAGGAAINVLAKQMGARVVVADFGVAADLPPHPELRAVKVRRGTGNIAREPAMSRDEAIAAIETGRRLFREELAKGLDVALTGDMGIGNTTCSAALICAFTGLAPRRVVGRGTGVDNDGLARKLAAVERALDLHRASLDDPLDALAAIGGLEVAGLVGVILEAACQRRPVIVDGFISGAAAMCAAAIAPGAKDYMIAAHRTRRQGLHDRRPPLTGARSCRGSREPGSEATAGPRPAPRRGDRCRAVATAAGRRRQDPQRDGDL